jgi:adenosine deaminase
MIEEKILKAGDLKAIKSIPKADIHAHMILSAPFEAYQEIAGAEIKTPPSRFDGGLGEFLDYLRKEVFVHLKHTDHLRHLLRRTFEHMIADGVVYTELSYDIHIPLMFQVTWPELVKIISDETAKYSDKLTVRPEFGIPRETDPNIWRENYIKALGTGYFESIDLYGAELHLPIEHFDPYIKEAQRRGLKIKIHSGEIGEPSRVLREYELYKPHAIQHGVRASEDPTVLEALAKSGVTVNVCPWSNYCLKVVESYETHPIGKMLRAGVKVTANTDDLTIFRRSLSEEYLALFTSGLLTPLEIETIRINGLKEKHS